VAIFSALLSALVRRLGSLIQALFGWSVTALFGKLPRSKEIAVSVTLVLAVVWPLLVVGIFSPRVANWAFAFLPLHEWVSDSILRVVWCALAVLVPGIIGLLTRFAAHKSSLRGGVLRTTLAGYPLTIGYCIAFIITLVTVPLVKISAAARGWSDEHIYVQSRQDGYNQALHAIAEAFVLAGLVPTVEPVPSHMSAATEILKWFAKSALGPILPEKPRRLTAEGVDAYLYPGDLLLRGKPERLGRVRAMLTRVNLERFAYLVSEARAQNLQDELARLWDVLERHRSESAPPIVPQRLGEIYREMNRQPISFENWTLLERQARSLERAAFGGPTLLDSESDQMQSARAKVDAIENAAFEKESLQHGTA
jgi:hypothetical protein